MAEHVLVLLRRINRYVALTVGLALLTTAGFVLLDITLRQLGASLGGTDEISGYAMAIASSWGMAYAMLEMAHVRIDFLRTRLSRSGRALFDLGAMLILAATITVIALRCWPVLETSLANASRANTPLETPLWWVQLPWLAGWIWFALTAWATLLCALALVLQKKFAASEAAVGTFGELEAAP